MRVPRVARVETVRAQVYIRFGMLEMPYMKPALLAWHAHDPVIPPDYLRE